MLLPRALNYGGNGRDPEESTVLNVLSTLVLLVNESPISMGNGAGDKIGLPTES
jgi:hypothetical protein